MLMLPLHLVPASPKWTKETGIAGLQVGANSRYQSVLSSHGQHFLYVN